ncbi:hypothetical protein D9757_002129 [Collybiopsis confluens]|uniref:Autophagy-related protein 14 n=1 Tax=Collybiopsis confluens TaxID=2823264 RepID=A0A8H5I052_9AGAR|nr:hypothetical protein D9757_002129 [Collybiopsis confluens]
MIQTAGEPAIPGPCASPLMSLEKLVPFQDEFDAGHLFQRRVAHITSIQIRNLTPFPARDTLASALSKPAELPAVTNGHLTDDLDATLARNNTKRTRRISTNSVTTLRSLRSDDGAVVPEALEGRTRTSSKLSDRPIMSGTIGKTAPTIRPAPRNRTTSVTSIFPAESGNAESSSKMHLPLKDYSQTGLENVIRSRLVETFLAVTAVPSEHSPAPVSRSPPSTPLSPMSLHSSSPSRDKFNLTQKSRRDSWASPRTSISVSSPGHTRSVSTVSRTTSASGKLGAGFPSTSPSTSAFPPSPGPSSPPPSVPNYLSSIHQSSTNPSFSFDPKSEFAPWTDLSSVKLKIGLWAKIGSERRDASNMYAKGKEKASTYSDSLEWQVLEEWNLNLNEMEPLPGPSTDSSEADETLSSFHYRQLPSNTLLVTLDPPGETFYAYAPSLSHSPHHAKRTMSSRSPKSTTGYSSDPESTVVQANIDPELKISSPLLSRRQRQRGRQGQRHDENIYDKQELSKTAGWKDLFKLVNLWATIKDNEKSLDNIVQGLDRLIIDDRWPLKREISERECRIAELRADCAQVSTESQEVRDEIRIRRERIRERQNTLLEIEQQEEVEQQERVEVEEELFDERARLETLRAVFVPTRTTLISTLFCLFPIELRSPPDLLFTIIEVPLPIPLSPNDPAPPLSLPEHSDVNEETIASALGYVALVLQLLAAYLGHVLIYPITYIGSRSLIRDGISAMVGPRMFPLFSKGVDKYRFEYGVFLLNKNIEMLTANQDLRAIDIRHTLPNLKNLLLTLTDGEGVPVDSSRRSTSPISSLSGLESPRPESPQSTHETLNGQSGTVTPKANGVVELPTETTPPASGSSTPIAPIQPTSGVSIDTLKKTSRFLGLSPLAGLLRVRYPSSLLLRNETAVELNSEDGALVTSSSPNGTNIELPNGDLGVRKDTLGEGSGTSSQATVNKVAEVEEPTIEAEAEADATLRVNDRLATVWKVH